MDIEFSQIHEMVYMHDIVNSDSKKKLDLPLYFQTPVIT